MSNLLAGGLTREDEYDVQAELDALIEAEETREVHRLPDVPQRRPGTRDTDRKATDFRNFLSLQANENACPSSHRQEWSNARWSKPISDRLPLNLFYCDVQNMYFNRFRFFSFRTNIFTFSVCVCFSCGWSVEVTHSSLSSFLRSRCQYATLLVLSYRERWSEPCGGAAVSNLNRSWWEN